MYHLLGIVSSLCDAQMACVDCTIGSRDQSVKIWALQASKPQLLHTLPFDSSVTSVACAPLLKTGEFVLAIGTESGSILTCLVNNKDNFHVERIWQGPDHLKHGGAVRKIKIRADSSCTGFTMVTCSNDHSLRVFQMQDKL